MYYRISDPYDVRDLGEQVAAWQAAGNPKANDWAEQPVAPSADAVWTADAEWVVPAAPTYTAEAWVAQYYTSLEIIALQRLEMTLAAAGKPLGVKMAETKQWLESVMLAWASDPTPRSDWQPAPYAFAEVSGEAVQSLQPA